MKGIRHVVEPTACLTIRTLTKIDPYTWITLTEVPASLASSSMGVGVGLGACDGDLDALVDVSDVAFFKTIR